MKYIAKVNGKTYEVEVERAAGAYAPIPRSVYTGEGESEKAGAASTAAALSAAEPAMSTAPAPSAAVPSATTAPESPGGTPVNSPMPGTVFKITAKEGQPVKAGEVLLILEAMKMEIEVAAPAAGTVKKFAVSEGNTVTADQLLATLG